MSPRPDDFEWKPRSHLDVEPTGLFLHGELVASMLQRVDGSWMARLHPEDGVDSPLILRPCRSFESGQHGCEMWAARHETALRAKVGKKLKWVKENVIAGRARPATQPSDGASPTLTLATLGAVRDRLPQLRAGQDGGVGELRAGRHHVRLRKNRTARTTE